MIRQAFTMKLKPGKLAEYKEQHDKIWPELVEEIERSGIASFTTFENDPHLFLYSEIHDRWSEIMAPFMVFREDGLVDFHILREIFHIETGAQAK